MSLQEKFSKNRAEEGSDDNWNSFVVPSFINELEIKTQTKALVIIGGRGCGKTTLLRYFCHATQFSPKRQDLPENTLNHIGLYWRADTNFLNSLAGGDQTDATWRSAFEHLLVCEFGKEMFNAIRSINCTAERKSKYGGFETLDFSALSAFDSSIGNSFADVEKYFSYSRTQLAMWINNLDTRNPPVFLPLSDFLKQLLELLKSQLTSLRNSVFAIFIDEYENLRDEQQKYINGLLKHGAPPLIFNIAMKRKAWQTKETLGPESIQDIHDLRVIDLEAELKSTFELFAAELLFFRLLDGSTHLESLVPVNQSQLRDVDRIDERYKNPEYRKKVINEAGKLLPRVTASEGAQRILLDNRLREQLLKKNKRALINRNSKLHETDFINEDFPDASLVLSALLFRDRENPEKLLEEFHELIEGKTNRLSSGKPLISNNLFGCVNLIYIADQRSSILFSGFETLAQMANGNIRNLLELIHRIFKRVDDEIKMEIPTVSPEKQAEAIREASEAIFNNVIGMGSYGPQLYNLASSLGSMFREYHRNDKQSEPEINHFTLSAEDNQNKLNTYLNEAEKWSVLYSTHETKMKAKGVIDFDYVLNPIFSAYFQISYRKKRSTTLSGSEVIGMIENDMRTRDHLIRKLASRSELNDIVDLFSELQDE